MKIVTKDALLDSVQRSSAQAGTGGYAKMSSLIAEALRILGRDLTEPPSALGRVLHDPKVVAALAAVVPEFLSEAKRVLAPDGLLLTTDLMYVLRKLGT